MRNPRLTQLLGHPGFMFEASYANMAGVVVDMQTVQVTMDTAHLLLMELRIRRFAKASQIAEGKKVIESIKLAP